ncbi:RHS repeat-associated core domain-containing protein [Nocardioides sp. BP30]|uniref:RHS repeat-associated core domain-containing protein n=1 Tax=Nocardioides sp. BP30 TaxID=3036374 RepID=UPI002468D0D7|nr:RHS repeat-associated core domain-containing protein [Nocardioides sp. BP30]WGL52641.1 RHS repeat-associated core domain-containing protein [Nocardioides sp. BP30]
MVATQTQGTGTNATTIGFTLDPDQNRISTQATTTTAGVKTITNHYDDGSDATAWTSTLKLDGTTVTKRYLNGIDGGLDAVVADDGTVKLDLTNLHGDTVATIDPDATSITSYHETTEFGLPRDPITAADDYGYLGAKKRSTDDLGGLTLMGARLYIPATGHFLSIDPIPGGNPNLFTYPADPIDEYDVTGQWPHWVKTALRKGADYLADHRGQIGALASGACLVVQPEVCLGVSVAVSFTTNAASVAEGKESLSSGVKHFAVTTSLGVVNYSLAKSIGEAAKNLKMAKKDYRVLKGTRKTASGALAVGTFLAAKTATRGGCRVTVKKNRPCE